MYHRNQSLMGTAFGQVDSFRLKLIPGDGLVCQLSTGNISYTWGNNFLGLKGGIWAVYYSIHSTIRLVLPWLPFSAEENETQ